MHEHVLSILLLFSWAAISAADDTCSGIVPLRHRGQNFSIAEFGGVGDGETLNTAAFTAAVNKIDSLKNEGGGLLYIPAGVYLTERFNLTSSLTLYLARGATIEAAQDTLNWPLADPLPSYGRGRERPGGRYMSFILGYDVHDVIITGENGTIDGQGAVWWDMFKRKTLPYTRPHLIEFMYSSQILISNVVLKNSPFWNIHPVYSSNFVAQFLTILAPANSPNTDGIDPDSSSNVCIEDSYMSTGDDLVAVKSGWDEYGIAYNRPSSNITIRRLTGSSPFAGIAVGSETSGGVENVFADHINLFNMGIGIHIKTKVGRGGFIRNVTISNMVIQKAKKGIRISGDVGDHADDQFNPNAIPIVEGITMKNITGEQIRYPGFVQGIKNAPFTNICLSNVNLNGLKATTTHWRCSNVGGSSFKVSPWPCPELISPHGSGSCFTQT